MLESLGLSDNETTRLLRKRLSGLRLIALSNVPREVLPEPPLTAQCNFIDDKTVVIVSLLKVYEKCFVASDTSAQIVCYADDAETLRLGYWYLLSHFKVFCARPGVFALVLQHNSVIDLDSPARGCTFCKRPCVAGIQKCNYHLSREFEALNECMDYKEASFTNEFAYNDLSLDLETEYLDYLCRAALPANGRKHPVSLAPQEAPPYSGRKVLVFYCLDCNRVYLAKWLRCERLKHRIQPRMIWKFEAVCRACNYRIVTLRNDERCIICGCQLENQVSGLEIEK